MREKEINRRKKAHEDKKNYYIIKQVSGSLRYELKTH